MKSQLLVTLLLLSVVIGCNPPALITDCSNATSQPSTRIILQRFDYTAPKMGTVFHMTFYAPDQAVADRAADAVWARVDQLNTMLTDYDPNSEPEQTRATNAGWADEAADPGQR